jgi:ATP-dependent protease ClpP protease subunit/uncharacterized protein YecT (DUF1311 family)
VKLKTITNRHGAEIQRLLSLLGVALLMFPIVADAMDFRIYYQPQLKLKMVIADGTVKEGDADKLRAIARRADRDKEGLVPLVLDSPGGNVEAAFRMVDVMDRLRVYTIVPDDAKCASACASILFASGERRSILGSGLLGFHSCYRRDGGAYAADSLCNEIIAANAMQRGVTHASINRFVEQYGAKEMAWVGRAIACTSMQGLCKPGLLETQSKNRTALKGSLDCGKLVSVQAQLVCSDPEVALIDQKVTTLYNQKLDASSSKTRLQAGQRAWLRDARNACRDKACLMRTYERRIDELKQMRS